MNFGGIGVELRMKERRIEKGIPVSQLVGSELAQGHLVVVADCLVFYLLIKSNIFSLIFNIFNIFSLVFP